MSLPRYFRRHRLTWKLLSVLAILACVVYFYLRPERTEKVVGKDTLNFRQERFDKYQRSEAGRTGPGEKGEGLQLSGAEKEKTDSLMDKEAFNIIASDKISLERSVRDVRDSRYMMT